MSNEYETFDSTFIRSDFIVCNQHHFWGSFMSNSGRGGFRPGAGRKSGWSDRGERGGRPATGKEYKTLSIATTPDEIEQIKQQASSAGKSVSRYIIDIVLQKDSPNS